jgi:hypothetical protein
MSEFKEVTIYPPVRIKIDAEQPHLCSPECPMLHQTWGYKPMLSCRLFGDISVVRTFEGVTPYSRMTAERIYRSTGCINCLSKGELPNES